MGNFYVNYTLRGPKPKDVVAALAGRAALVTPEQAGCVVAYDAISDDQDTEEITELGEKLSARLHCPVLAVLNHEDELLWYQLHEDGELTDEYDSAPGYADSAAHHTTPEGGDAALLCQVFECGSPMEVERILRRRSGITGYAFAIERHEALAVALGLPGFSVGAGYEDVSECELPEGLNPEDLLKSR